MAAKKKAQAEAAPVIPAKHPGGRPTKFSPELADEICNMVAEGDNLTRICSRTGMPRFQAVRHWLLKDPEFSQEYARAREARGDARADRMDEIGDKLERGEIDANTARVLMDKEKWLAGKEQPARYGDNASIKIDQTTRIEPVSADQMADEMRQSPALRREIEEMLAKSSES